MKPAHLLLALALLFGGTAAAQNAMTPVVATQITLGGALISSGTISITPVDRQGTMLPLTTADGKFYLPGPISAPITAGAVSGLTVPDQCTATFTTPNTPINMRVDIIQTANGKTVQATFISPATAPFFCGSTAVALDHYSPAQTAQASAAGIISTPTVPAHCTSPSVYYPPTGDTPVVRVCIAGAFVAVNTSSGEGSGSQLTWSGTWSSSTGYTANQAVLRNGSTYVALQPSTNQDPATATLYWQLIAQKGSDGATGATGAAATVAVGTVATGAAGSSASVTNAGTTSAAILNFTIPKGDKGDTGNTGASGANGADAVLGYFAFASFPSTGLVANKTIVIQTDAVVGSTCTQGGGSVRRLCLWNGTSWVPADNFAAEKGVANGIASLDSTGVIPSTQTPSATSTAKGSVVLPSNAPTNQLGSSAILRYVARVQADDDSYGAGAGASTSGSGAGPTSFWGLLRRDTPSGTPMPNRAFTGWTMAQIVNDFFGSWYPDASAPTVIAAGGAENDLSGSTSADPIYLQNVMMFHDIWATIPQAYQVNATGCSGTGWSAGDTAPIAGSGTTTTIFWFATTASKSLTCNVPSSNTGTTLWIKSKYIVGGTGAWTITVDGNPLTDNGTGTTTFSNAPPNSSVAAAGVGFAEQFTITPGAHTVVFTTTASNASRVDIGGIAWAPPAWNPTTGQLGVPNQTVVFRRNTVAGVFANSATVNPAIATETAKLFAAGLPVFFEDLNSPVGGVPAVPAMNTTTDYAGTTLPSHFGDAGQLHWKQHFLATQQAYNFVFSAPNVGGGVSGDGVLLGPLHVQPSKCTLFLDCISTLKYSLSNVDVGGGAATYVQGGSLMVLRSGKDASSGKPFSGSYLQELASNTGLSAGTAVASEITSTAAQSEANVTNHAVFRNNTGTLVSDTGITSSPVPAITSATTITPTTTSALVGGSAAIVTITPMADCTTTGYGCSLTLLPASSSTWTLATGGNIYAACTPTVGRPVLLFYLASASTPLWYPYC